MTRLSEAGLLGNEIKQFLTTREAVKARETFSRLGEGGPKGRMRVRAKGALGFQRAYIRPLERARPGPSAVGALRGIADQAERRELKALNRAARRDVLMPALGDQHEVRPKELGETGGVSALHRQAAAPFRALRHYGRITAQ